MIRIALNRSFVLLFLMAGLYGKAEQLPAKYTIQNVEGLGDKFHQGTVFSLDEILSVQIKEDVDSLLLHYNKADKPLMLWLNGVAFPNLNIWRVDKSQHKLLFKLVKDTVQSSSWDIFFSYNYRGLFVKPLVAKLSLGTKENNLTNAIPIRINLTEQWMIYVGLGLIALLLAIFVFFVRRNELLRDSLSFADNVRVVSKYSSDPQLAANEILKRDLPYSLARTQLVFWTLLVAIAFIFVWANVDQLPALTGTTALLIGICGGTSVVGKIIDKDRMQRSAGAGGIDVATFKLKYKSLGFFNDILSDPSGLSVNRFQLVVFTTILGIYFLWYVIYNLSMPVFSDSLLLLMGVSNTTYAGVKFSEN